jgi:hypothetical protein
LRINDVASLAEEERKNGNAIHFAMTIQICVAFPDAAERDMSFAASRLILLGRLGRGGELMALTLQLEEEEME